MFVFLLSILLISFSFSSHLTINVTERYHTFEPNSGRVVQVVEGKRSQSLMATPVYVDEDEVVNDSENDISRRLERSTLSPVPQAHCTAKRLDGHQSLASATGETHVPYHVCL